MSCYMSNVGMHYHLDQPRPIIEPPFICQHTVMARILDMTDQLIVDEIIRVAIKEGVDDLYVLDKKFVLDAIREKMEREGIK